MTDRIRAAFDTVHADEALKQRTREYLHRTVYQRGRRKAAPLRRLRPILAAACLLLVLCAGGSYLYFTPTAFISIDVNPSLELGVNRFDRVVSVEAFNQDGQALADGLDVKNLDYRDALEQILADQSVTAYLSEGILSLTVAGEDEGQCAEIYQTMEDCASGRRNVRCHAGSSDAMEQAHTAGMSVGKYQAYLILRELDPDITAEQVRGMTMREIYQLIDACAREQGVDPLPAETASGAYGHEDEDEHGGCGYGYGCGVRGHRHGGG